MPNISDSEWEVMKIIWEKQNITAQEIIKELTGKSNWKGTTVKTLINRLLNKGIISFEKKGKEYYYYSLISKDESIKEESLSFINRIFNGSINSLLLNLVNTKELSNQDIQELKDILNKAEREE